MFLFIFIPFSIFFFNLFFFILFPDETALFFYLSVHLFLFIFRTLFLSLLWTMGDRSIVMFYLRCHLSQSNIFSANKHISNRNNCKIYFLIVYFCCFDIFHFRMQGKHWFASAYLLPWTMNMKHAIELYIPICMMFSNFKLALRSGSDEE